MIGSGEFSEVCSLPPSQSATLSRNRGPCLVTNAMRVEKMPRSPVSFSST